MTTVVSLAQRVFSMLADGQCHSGEALAQQACVTRSAIWKAIEQLRKSGLEIKAATHRGYSLVSPCEVFDVQKIRMTLQKSFPSAAEALRSLEVVWEIESTNATLLAAPAPPANIFDLLFTENQIAGRGRRGRSWSAALGGSVCFSIATSYDTVPRELPALTLAIGVCVLRVLRAHGAIELLLKWPNDLQLAGQKIGGILVELRAEASGPAQVVVGIGLNLKLPSELRLQIEASGTKAADLSSSGIRLSERNALVAEIAGSCITGLSQFNREGFAPFLNDWRAADALRNQSVRVLQPSGELVGTARGIDAHGVLQVETSDQKIILISAGEVSVRTVSSL